MSATVKSLKKENDSLKEQVSALTRDFKNLEQMLSRREVSTTENGRQANSPDAETQSNMEFYSRSYDDLNRFRTDAAEELQRLRSRLNDLTDQVEGIASAIEETKRYSYQYNVKIIGIPERDPRESALGTTTLCIGLFKALGVEVFNQDIDIAHRVPTINASSGPRPIICKFVRRIVREQVMNARKNACKVRSADVGLPDGNSLEAVRIFDHLTPQVQKLLADTKKFQMRNGFRYSWTKNFIVYLRQFEDSRPIPIKRRSDLETFAQREGLPLS